MNEEQLIQQRQQQLAQVYDPQEQFIQQQKAALPGQFAGQRSALEQAKVNAFRDISQTANRRGMFFSGFQPAEQARYLGEQFLPGMQDVAARQETARLGLLEQLIGLRGQRAGEMTKFQEQLRQENLQRQRDQEAFQQKASFQRSAGGGGGGGGGSTRTTSQPSQTATVLNNFAKSRGAITTRLESVKGGDGYISPGDFQAARRAALQMGWSADLFNRNFSRYINPSHAQDYYR